MNPQERAVIVKQLAMGRGFDFCGIAKARYLEEESPKVEMWLNKGYHGKMQYMENHFDKRLDPCKLVPGARSVISLLLNYYPARPQNPGAPKISKYAAGEDYHKVIKDKLYLMLEDMRHEFGEIDGRVFVDSAPVMERQWAALAGLGWLGKNGLLLRKKQGSFFFIAQLIVDLELVPDGPVTDHCGECTLCIDACPTQAIVGAQLLDASRCISYLTIELKDKVPVEFHGSMENWAYGCDICQDVCPWNKFSQAHGQAGFEPTPAWDWETRDWLELSEEVFRETFGSSAMQRAGFRKVKQNLEILTKNA